MTINSLKDLKKLIQLCQSQNVKVIKIDNIQLELGEKPVTYKPSRKMKPIIEPGINFPPNGIDAQTVVPQMYTVDTQGFTKDQLEYFLSRTVIPQKDYIESDELTEEQLLFYSAESPLKGQ